MKVFAKEHLESGEVGYMRRLSAVNCMHALLTSSHAEDRQGV